MKPNPILEEVWRIKDELAREADYDVHRLCENTRQWAAAHPHPGPIIRSADELRQFLQSEEVRLRAAHPVVLKDEPPRTE